MGLFTNLKLVSKVVRVVNEVKECLQANNTLAEQLKEVVAIFATGFDRLKQLLPDTADVMDDIIKIIKKG